MQLECWYRPFPLSPDFLKDKFQLVPVYTTNLHRGVAIQLHSFFTFVLDRGERSVKRTGESAHRITAEYEAVRCTEPVTKGWRREKFLTPARNQIRISRNLNTIPTELFRPSLFLVCGFKIQLFLLIFCLVFLSIAISFFLTTPPNTHFNAIFYIFHSSNLAFSGKLTRQNFIRIHQLSYLYHPLLVRYGFFSI